MQRREKQDPPQKKQTNKQELSNRCKNKLMVGLASEITHEVTLGRMDHHLHLLHLR